MIFLDYSFMRSLDFMATSKLLLRYKTIDYLKKPSLERKATFLF